MKRVITYGTFDLFHKGHENILERAKKLGDYLIVGVTTDNYDESRGKLNVQETLVKRIENVKKSGLADEIIIEEYEGQKIDDIQRFNIDIFVIGSDWVGKFDYLNEFCKVVYLERTKGVSSTELRAQNSGILQLGMIGYGRIAKRFLNESKFVSGVSVEGVFGLNSNKLEVFTKDNELRFYDTNYQKFLDRVDAVYIASPHLSHYNYIKEALLQNKHVLCEKPMVLSETQCNELFALAKEKNCVLIEAIKTAFSPGFIRLISLAKSGAIGHIKNIDATFTKLVEGNYRELDLDQAGGSVTELCSYPLLAIVKLLGNEPCDFNFYTFHDKNKKIDVFTKGNIIYKNALATFKVALGVKSEGNLIIAGTKGYIYVPAPWWKTEYFEVRFENENNNSKYFYKFEGDGLRYELAEFLKLINDQATTTYKLTSTDSKFICRIIENFRKNQNVTVLT